MPNRTVDIIGGGPAGLAAARLIKLADPSSQVTVYERSQSNTSTFGFGVGLTGATMRNLAAVDPETAERVREESYAGHRLTLRENDRDVELHGSRNLAIGRATLLKVLADAASDIGVDIRMGARLEVTDSTADVVIAADGAHSDVRRKLASELGVSITHGRLHFMWCGADFATDTAFFTAKGPGDIRFVAHAYPYADDRSTFLVEADDVTWNAAGLAANDTAVHKGGTDEKSIALLEQVFSNDLRGRRLLTNRTRWARFPTVVLQKWYSGNVVLIGDAAHTAHYTIGSGTKLAIEDGIGLAEALNQHNDVSTAFEAYQHSRRPAVDRFKFLAARSQNWWETFRDRCDRLPEEIALSYMTRAGNLTVADYAREYPDTARVAMRHLGDAPVFNPDQLDDWILAQPGSGRLASAQTREMDAVPVGHAVRTVEWAGGNITGLEADNLCGQAIIDENCSTVVITGPADAAAVGNRIDLAERLHAESTYAVVVAIPRQLRAMAAAAVATRRCDAVVTTP